MVIHNIQLSCVTAVHWHELSPRSLSVHGWYVTMESRTEAVLQIAGCFSLHVHSVWLFVELVLVSGFVHLFS